MQERIARSELIDKTGVQGLYVKYDTVGETLQYFPVVETETFMNHLQSKTNI